MRNAALKRVWRRSIRSWWPRAIACLLAVLLVFSVGVEVGNGRLSAQFFSHTKSENPSLPTQLDYSSVTQLYQTLKQNYDGKLTATQLVDGLKQGLAEATKDPYTEYFTPQDAKAFQDSLNNSFSGIGAELGKDNNGNLIIVAPLKGFPADKAGLKAQDIITSIDNVDATGMSPDIAVSKIRGPSGTQVRLGILRDSSQTLSFTLVREDIQLPSVTSKILSGNIGYMQIISFSDDTSQLAAQAAQQFKQAGVKGIVLDLRGNPGGLLSAAVDVSSLWLPEHKTIVTEKGTTGTLTYSATGNDSLNGLPTAVLIDNGSASASEITAGALHDNNVARLIGEKSFGKGVVQQLIDFNDGSELKVTVASWYRPDGQNINKQGILPDQAVSLSDNDAKTGNDTQLIAAEAYLTSRE